jgi:mRNA interferase MazF
MARLLRGDVYWANLNPVQGHEQAEIHPMVIASHEVFNERSGTVIAMATTSRPQRAGFPLTYELRSGNLPKQSWVKISQIKTLSTARLENKIGRVVPEEVSILIEGLNEIVSG